MNVYNPNMWIMKITPGNPKDSLYYFKKLFVEENCKNLIGYSKSSGKIEEFYDRWERIDIGDLIVVIEGFNKVIGVVEITSNSFDDIHDEKDHNSDWFYHRRKAKLIHFFDPIYLADSNTNRDTIIEYSGDGAIGIIDEVWDIIKDNFDRSYYSIII